MFKRWYMVSLYSVTHFLVDFTCAFIMFRNISRSPDWHICILIYNFCAFAMQMPLGIVADKLNRNYLFAGIGCIMVAGAYGLTSLPLIAAVVAGMGNGAFHIGGGIDVLNISEEKSGALGVYVSPGAFGVYFGTMSGKGTGLPAIPVLIALLVMTVLIFAARRIWGGAYVDNAPLSPPVSSSALIAAGCLFLVVCLRSYVGLALNFPWKSAGYWGLALVCATVFGKVAGGILSDRLGQMKTAVISLGAAAVLFLVPGIPVAGVVAVLLFNMTMPVTLWVLAKTLPGAKGFSFGLLTFALFLGFLPVYRGAGTPPAWMFAALAASSLVILIAGLVYFKKVSAYMKTLMRS